MLLDKSVTADRSLPLESRYLTDPWGQMFRYEAAETSFRIVSSGPDRSFGTPDDVIYDSTVKDSVLSQPLRR